MSDQEDDAPAAQTARGGSRPRAVRTREDDGSELQCRRTEFPSADHRIPAGRDTLSVCAQPSSGQQRWQPLEDCRWGSVVGREGEDCYGEDMVDL